ncbi:HAD family hydrolase [Lactobacillus sp. 0.1XD8-4]|uniref:HAD family hydrolase n=1 Tax=uncultured Limosilactobacillus sp. TaxID=2837629 RepID=UPI00129D9289|nr:HAD family hydrolase [uncultured Limosilactobacillus sp.]MRN06514.1 HAD family hydrolase [Lactobacillus sp. 0.1XD8-4]
MTKLKNFIFDIDGTLINTCNMYMPALFVTLKKNGYYFSASQIKELKKRIYGLAATNALEYLGVPHSEVKIINREWLRAAYQNFNEVKIFNGIPDVLRKMAADPDNHLAIVTSKTEREYQQYFQDKYDFASVYSVVVTADKTNRHKPDSEPIVYAMKEMKANPRETIYIGDMQTDLLAAHRAGIKFAGALYGSINPEALKKADYLLRSPRDLLKI